MTTPINIAVPPTITLRSGCYNHGRFVTETLDSVAAQDCGEFEWIIVDDASTDDSAARIRGWLGLHGASLRERKIDVRFIAHERNVGIARTFNEILNLAQGQFLCGLSCDDRMLPQRMSAAKQHAHKFSPDDVCFYGDSWIIDEDGTRKERLFIEGHRDSEDRPEGELFQTLLAGNFIPSPSVIVRRDALISAGGYDESLPYEDYDMWLRLSRKGRFRYYHETLIEYRIHGENLHQKISDWRRINYWIFRKHIDHEDGVRRFFGNLRGLEKHGQISPEIWGDLRSLDLAGYPDWERKRRAILAADV
ncbi:MAG: glycosyltransferase [Verrucomicrobiales bacterium]